MDREWKAAAAAVSAAIGIGISSGRSAVFFFAQMGRASWIGVLAASALFGILCGTAALAASETGSTRADSVLGLLVGRWLSAVHCGLMLFVMIIMLAEAGKLAMLALPVRRAFWIGVLTALGLSSLLCLRGMSVWGILTIALCTVFYALLALDSRPVRIAANYETEATLRNSAAAAMVLSAMHAALSASAAMEGVMSGGVKRPWKLALRAGEMMLLLLLPVNAAILRGGERLLSQPMPEVILAARLGKTGYYGCIFVKWMCTLATLNAALSALTGKTGKRRKS